MGELAFLGTIVGANAGLICFALWIVAGERAEYDDRLAALGSRTSSPWGRRA